MKQRLHIQVGGIVQGVGFRPFVHRLAAARRLAGFVCNDPGGVHIEIEGPAGALQAFRHVLLQDAPPLAHITDIETHPMPVRNDGPFRIRESAEDGVRTVFIAPDTGTCEDCLREFRDPADRRFRYPFINCTTCGPRYTIIRGLPYDRAKTTMARFRMCAACRAEYDDPENRRFHAEPLCCPACGPRLELVNAAGEPVGAEDPVRETVRLLEAGAIIAVKGLGGFHLACDATRPETVGALRRRKKRDLKPFALMAADLAAAERFCHVPEEARYLLTGPEKPVLLLEKKKAHLIAPEVAPRNPAFGVMLPYTPLHELLMEGHYPALVMTSGNISEEPIAYTNEDALGRLAMLADYFLLHDRDIHVRTDDSVLRQQAGRIRFLRRSRGYAPFPVALPFDTGGCEVLAVGPELNNTVCLTRKGHAFLSHHLGDLHNLSAYESFLQAIAHLRDVLEVSPDHIACDLHPAYLSTRHARESGIPVIPVQHHHAHIASVLAEHGREDRVIGLAFDGIGWGDDDLPWGGEFLIADFSGYDRAGHLERIPQPGGDHAAKNPAVMAFAFLRQICPQTAEKEAADLLGKEHDGAAVLAMLEKGVNCPLTSSAGRLFDAASALLGICQHNHFHAQAPMALEAAAWRAREEKEPYKTPGTGNGRNLTRSGHLVLNSTAILRAMIEDYRQGTSREVCAARFHNSVIHAALDICRCIRENTGIETAALSGGTFANVFLTERLKTLLEKAGFDVLLNSAVPPGDGGVSLGQAAVAAWRKKHVCSHTDADSCVVRRPG
jgi:hydrogenase maturation protein HypF